MFFAPAHSFIQQARLAITLAWVAGYTNVISVLVCGTAVSHVSGTTSHLGEYLAHGSWRLAALMAYLIVMFFSGAVLSALCTEYARARQWHSIYVLPMGIEAFLLALFALVLEIIGPRPEPWSYGVWISTALATLAMGVQNATITSISNGVVRTTHVTGVLTDLGLESVRFLRWAVGSETNIAAGSTRSIVRSVRQQPTSQRLALLLSILGSFLLGAILGTILYEVAWQVMMAPPVVLLLWIIYQDISRPIAELEASNRTLNSDAPELPCSIALFHFKPSQSRRTGQQRLPDLTSWSSRLSSEVRVVVLDLAAFVDLDRSSMSELKSCALQLEARGCRLIIAGIDDDTARRSLPRGTDVDAHIPEICGELDQAIARAMALVIRDIKEKNPVDRNAADGE